MVVANVFSGFNISSVCIVYTFFHAVNPICKTDHFLLLIANLLFLSSMLHAYSLPTSKVPFLSKSKRTPLGVFHVVSFPEHLR